MEQQKMYWNTAFYETAVLAHLALRTVDCYVRFPGSTPHTQEGLL